MHSDIETWKAYCTANHISCQMCESEIIYSAKPFWEDSGLCENCYSAQYGETATKPE